MRRTVRRVVATAGLVLAGSITALAGLSGAASVGAASPTTITCSGIIPSGTYASLLVPASSSCEIASTVTITGPVTMGVGSFIGWTSGSLTVEGALRVGPNSALISDDVTVEGPLSTQTNSDVQLAFSTIGGPVSATNFAGLLIFHDTVAGPVRVHSTVPSGGLFVGESHISGPVSVTNFVGTEEQIDNSVMGPLTFSDNAASTSGPPHFSSIFISGNTINGPATCSDNTPAPNSGLPPFEPNVVSGPIRGDQAATCIGVPGGA